MDGGEAFMPGVPGFPPGASWARPSHKKPPAGAGGLRVACLPPCHAQQVRTVEMRPVGQHGWQDGFQTRCPRVSTRGFLGATVPQKAPGGSRGTPGRMPSPVPCATGSHRGNASSRTAWIAGRFSCPESPGCHPGLLVARPSHKKPPAGAGGLRVACLPPCHALRARTEASRRERKRCQPPNLGSLADHPFLVAGTFNP